MDRCKEPGCGKNASLTGSGRCHEHARQFREEQSHARASAAAQIQAAAAQADLASAQAEAARQDAETREAQAYAAMDEEQREAVMVREKRDADREKLKQMFDKLGDCVACIEQDGAGTHGINLSPFPGGHIQGHAATYRYTNLAAARGYLIDMREEMNHIHHWEAAASREHTLARIETYLTRSKDEMVTQARRASEELAARWVKIRAWGLLVLIFGIAAAMASVAIGCPGIAIGGPISIWVLMKGLSRVRNPWDWSLEVARPNNWQAMLDAAR
jgi:hypothetical protein